MLRLVREAADLIDDIRHPKDLQNASDWQYGSKLWLYAKQRNEKSNQGRNATIHFTQLITAMYNLPIVDLDCRLDQV
jgi:hypothetical protein